MLTSLSSEGYDGDSHPVRIVKSLDVCRQAVGGCDGTKRSKRKNSRGTHFGLVYTRMLLNGRV